VALAIVGSAIWVLVHVALGAHFALAAINAVEFSKATAEEFDCA
jgi:hypothetical protein